MALVHQAGRVCVSLYTRRFTYMPQFPHSTSWSCREGRGNQTPALQARSLYWLWLAPWLALWLALGLTATRYRTVNPER